MQDVHQKGSQVSKINHRILFSKDLIYLDAFVDPIRNGFRDQICQMFIERILNIVLAFFLSARSDFQLLHKFFEY